MSIHVLTIATESKYYFPYLLKSAEKYNYNLHILGYNEKWKGFNWRNKLIFDYLDKLNDDDIVFFIDAYDVLFIRDSFDIKNEFLSLYNKHKFKMVVGYENMKHSSIFTYFFVKHKFKTCKNVSLNAGTYGGFVKDVKFVLNNILNIDDNDDSDDQKLLTSYCHNTNDIYIDTKNKLFLTIGVPYKEVSNFLEIDDYENVTYNKNNPFILHGPLSFLDDVVLRLNLDDECSISEILKDKHGYLIYIFHAYTNTLLCIFFVLVFCIIYFVLHK